MQLLHEVLYCIIYSLRSNMQLLSFNIIKSTYFQLNRTFPKERVKELN